MKLDGIEIVSRLFCEDVREEKSNKHIIIGAYSGDMLVSNFPGMVNVCTYLEIIIDLSGKYEFFIRYSGPGEGSATIKLDVNTENEGSIHTFHVPKMGLNMEKEGVFEVDFSLDGEKTWHNLIKKNVSLAPNASQQPS